MPAPGRKMFGFLKGSKHRRGSKGNTDREESVSKRSQRLAFVETQAQEIPSEPEPSVSISDSQENTSVGPEDDSMFAPVGTAYSNLSLTAKPTTATLGETFSSGGVQEVIGYVDSRDESVEVQNSECLYSEALEYDEYEYCDEHPMHQASDGYTEFVNGTQEEDTDTLDYTATVHDLPYNSDDHSDTMAAHHERSVEYQSLVGGLHNTTWEETSLGYETCERTLNTNLEGINFLPDASVIEHQPTKSFSIADATAHTRTIGNGPSAHTCMSASTGFLHPSERQRQMRDDPQYVYDGEGYDQYQESYGAEGYCYDDEGNLMANSYPDGDGQFVDDFNTIANSTIETDGIETTMGQPIIATDLLPSQFEADGESAPFDSYQSEDSCSTFDDEVTRDMSLLDEGDTVADEDDNSDDEEEDSDSNSDSSDSDDEAGGRPRRRRSSPPKSMMQIINELKDYALQGSDDSDVEEDASDDDEDLPDVAQISTAATSVTSMTHSFDTGKDNGRKKKQRPRRKKVDRNLDNLFNKVSALGQELLGAEDEGPKRKGRKSLRRRERDPATRIVDSLRDIFNCGHPKHY